MINEALDFLVEQLNEYIQIKTSFSSKVKLGMLFDDTGKEVTGDNLIYCQLVNIEEERIGKAQLPIAPPVGSSFPVRNPEIKLNTCILFAAIPGSESTDYSTSVQLLSLVIQFFQYRHVFNTSNSPSLPPELDTLIMELYPLTLENQNYLWGTLGAKYKPSVVYKLRLVTVLDDSIVDSTGAPRILDHRSGKHKASGSSLKRP